MKKKTVSLARASVQTAPLPSISTTIGECHLVIEGLGEMRSEIVGDYSIGQRLGFAHAHLTRKDGSFSGISGDVHKAFELVEADLTKRRITARLASACPIMPMKAADPAYMAAVERQHSRS